MRAGDLSNDTWLKVRKNIDELYAWGSNKEENFRYTGLNVEVVNKNKERYVELNQDFYLEDLPPLAISDERLRLDPKTSLTDGEMAACRALLGALQWTATQTQIQACARVNLLLTELTVNKNMAVAVEINQLIKDLKKDPMQIRLWQLPRIDHWQQWVVVTMADQAHANRPQGGLTGGILTCLGGPEQATGDAGKLQHTISWRSWRLKRKAISTNDGEMQATLEGEDSNFRVRFMWAQLNGCCAINDGNILDKANKLVSYVRGIVVTDSKGVFDACNKTDAPLLGMSNARSALQGYQLKEQLKESGCRLVWVSGDWNLSDSLTNKTWACRDGLAQFKKNNVWRLRLDENFIQSEKKAKRLGTSAIQQIKSLVAHDPRKALDWCDDV